MAHEIDLQVDVAGSAPVMDGAEVGALLGGAHDSRLRVGSNVEQL